MLINYASAKGWDIYDIYCDENYSGIDSSRPEYNRLLRDAQMGLFDIILCKTQSRFSRNMEDIEHYLNGKLQEWGVRFVSVVDNVDTYEKSGKKARQINGLINEWYLEDLSENIRAVLKSKHKNGKSTRAFMPYGLKKSKSDKNKAEIDPVASKVVKEIFDRFIEGKSPLEIADILNKKNVPSPQLYKKLSGEKLNLPKKSKDCVWTAQAIMRTLQNPMYTGDLVHNIYSKPSYKYKRIVKNTPDSWCITPNTHSAIIDRATFNKANEIIKSKKRNNFNFICGECKGKMSVNRKKYKNKTYLYLKCPKCGVKINGDIFIKFTEPKYRDKIEKIIVNNQYGCRVFFK
ncbi:MAG: recombinase family protein [Clostridia bacterium]|nr:recombinase family protein [Clostridia bacterium]